MRATDKIRNILFNHFGRFGMLPQYFNETDQYVRVFSFADEAYLCRKD